jgi:hypothetical protein
VSLGNHGNNGNLGNLAGIAGIGEVSKQTSVPIISQPIPKAPKLPSLDEQQRRFSLLILPFLRDAEYDATLIAEKVFANLRGGHGGDKGATGAAGVAASLASLVSGLTGATLSEPGFKGLNIERLQSELEELGMARVPEEDRGEAEGERRYRVSWQMEWGGLKAGFEQIVTLGAEAGYLGLGSLGDNEMGKDGVEELRKKVRELEERLKMKEREVGRLKEGVMRAVVGA